LFVYSKLRDGELKVKRDRDDKYNLRRRPEAALPEIKNAGH
jgi:hypothetical protein